MPSLSKASRSAKPFSARRILSRPSVPLAISRGPRRHAAGMPRRSRARNRPPDTATARQIRSAARAGARSRLGVARARRSRYRRRCHGRNAPGPAIRTRKSRTADRSRFRGRSAEPWRYFSSKGVRGFTCVVRAVTGQIDPKMGISATSSSHILRNRCRPPHPGKLPPGFYHLDAKPEALSSSCSISATKISVRAETAAGRSASMPRGRIRSRGCRSPARRHRRAGRPVKTRGQNLRLTVCGWLSRPIAVNTTSRGVCQAATTAWACPPNWRW